MKSTPRIYIDCSFIDFSRQPTGIPRVVLKYIEVGYAWGKQHGVEVVPVVPLMDGLVVCRPVPGVGAPQSLLERVKQSEYGARPSRSRLATKLVLRWFTDIVHHAVYLAASIVPIPPMKATAAWIDGGLQKLCSSYEQSSDNKTLQAIRFSPRKGDILFAPAYWHDVEPAVYASLKAQGLVIVILVHDLLPVAFENFYPSPWRYLFKDNVVKAFTYASAFFCVSNLTRVTLSEFSQRQKTPSIPMMTAYNGFEPLVSDQVAAEIRTGEVKPQLGKAGFYAICELQPLLMVGSVEPKKGHIPVIKCLEAMWGAGFERPLLIIGRPGWMERDVVEKIERSSFYNSKLFWFANIDDYDLATAYLLCHGLIFSSLAEGFGIPMIEASYYRKPTIALNTPIVREVLGEKGLLFSSAAEFVDCVISLEDSNSYAAACDRAESLRWPSWSDYTPHVFDVLLRIGQSNAVVPAEISVRQQSVPISSVSQPPLL